MVQICSTIDINMDRECAECRKGGATGSGICLGCTAKAMHDKPLRSEIGRAVQKRIHEAMKANHGNGVFQQLGGVFNAATQKE